MVLQVSKDPRTLLLTLSDNFSDLFHKVYACTVQAKRNALTNWAI